MASVADRNLPSHRDHSLCLRGGKLTKITRRHKISGNPNWLEAELLAYLPSEEIYPAPQGLNPSHPVS
ncbi:hypothetical protein P5673_011070 [Acropora cervicornis]|uniref:Uncharacterized protein n=1 Tax=Acropora cervicornis TaxID=6130 RepID=A0AAD9QQ97_ACRCE|nr:hypothetical protein P5673_011070 [Acropora cervicornis]